MLDFTGTKISDSARRGLCPEAECHGKTPYASKAEAIRRIKFQQQRGLRRRRGFKQCILTPYHCPHCHQWHVGGTSHVVRRTAK